MSKPVAFYRGDWKGDLVFRKNNTVDVRKNKSDFTKGLIKPLYADNPNQPQLTIPKSVADEIKEKDLDVYGITNSLPKQVVSVPEWFPFYDLSDVLIDWCEKNEKWWAIMDAYLAGKALGVDLVKVVEG